MNPYVEYERAAAEFADARGAKERAEARARWDKAKKALDEKMSGEERRYLDLYASASVERLARIADAHYGPMMSWRPRFSLEPDAWLADARAIFERLRGEG